MVASLEALCPEVLLEYDSGAGVLKATGCPKHLDTVRSLVEAGKEGFSSRWDAAVEKQLWMSGLQRGVFQHGVLGFSLRQPSAEWKLASLQPDAIHASRLGGQPLFGMTFYCKNDLLTFLALEFPEARDVKEMAESDSRHPLALWPQAVRETRWPDTILAGHVSPRGGLHTPQKGSYRSRMLWNTGTEKIVCDRVYFTQGSGDDSPARLYLFMAQMGETSYRSRRQALENFASGFVLPDRISPVNYASAKPLSSPVVAQPRTASPKEESLAYRWRLEKDARPAVREAVASFRRGDAKKAESLWTELAKSLPPADRGEALWFLAQSQMRQGNNRKAISTWKRFEREAEKHPLRFEAALACGTLLGHRLREWDQAEAEWSRAAQLARTDAERWQAEAKLATVPYYKKQHRPAVEALESLLKKYPTRQTADFVRPFLWYLKNCAEKKI